MKFKKDSSRAPLPNLTPRQQGIQKRRGIEISNKEITFREACHGEDIAFIKRLLETLPNETINKRDKDGLTAFLYAFTDDNPYPHALEIVKLLLESDTVDVKAVSENKMFLGANAAILACDNGKNKLVPLLLDSPRTSHQFSEIAPSGATAFMRACANSWNDIVKLLLREEYQNIVDVDTPYPDNTSPFAYTCQRIQEEADDDDLVEALYKTLELLLTSPRTASQLNRPNDEGNTPLMIASLNGDVRLVKFLLKQPHIIVNLCNADGKKASDLTSNQEIKDLIRRVDVPPEQPAAFTQMSCD